MANLNNIVIENKEINIVNYSVTMQGNLYVGVPTIDGQKRYDLACGGTNQADVDAGIKMLSIAIDACKGDINMAVKYIVSFKDATCNGLTIDKKLEIGNQVFGINTETYEGYVESVDTVLSKVADLSQINSEELVKYPEEFKLLLLTTKLQTLCNNAPIAEEIEGNISTEAMPMIDFLIFCNKKYLAGCPVIDDKLQLNMGCISTSADTLKDNLNLWKKGIEFCDGDAAKAARFMYDTGMLFANDIYPDMSVDINGYEVLICSKERKAYLGTEEISNLEDLGNVGLGKDAIKTLLTDRATLWLNENMVDEYCEDEDCEGCTDANVVGDIFMM